MVYIVPFSIIKSASLDSQPNKIKVIIKILGKRSFVKSASLINSNLMKVISRVYDTQTITIYKFRCKTFIKPLISD